MNRSLIPAGAGANYAWANDHTDAALQKQLVEEYDIWNPGNVPARGLRKNPHNPSCIPRFGLE